MFFNCTHSHFGSSLEEKFTSSHFHLADVQYICVYVCACMCMCVYVYIYIKQQKDIILFVAYLPPSESICSLFCSRCVFTLSCSSIHSQLLGDGIINCLDHFTRDQTIRGSYFY